MAWGWLGAGQGPGAAPAALRPPALPLLPRAHLPALPTRRPTHRSRFCPGGCTSKRHRPSEPLRLVFALDDAALLARTTFAWTCSSLDLAALTPGATTKQSLVIPATAAGQAVFADGATLVVSVTATADGKSATASLAVTVARRPACTAGASCLAVSPASGAADAAFVASASGIAADSALAYDFGLQAADGSRDAHARGSAEPSFTFAPRVLGAGSHTVYACARGAWRPVKGCWFVCRPALAPALRSRRSLALPPPPLPLPAPQTRRAPRPAGPPL